MTYDKFLKMIDEYRNSKLYKTHDMQELNKVLAHVKAVCEIYKIVECLTSKQDNKGSSDKKLFELMMLSKMMGSDNEKGYTEIMDKLRDTMGDKKE